MRASGVCPASASARHPRAWRTIRNYLRTLKQGRLLSSFNGRPCLAQSSWLCWRRVESRDPSESNITPMIPIAVEAARSDKQGRRVNRLEHRRSGLTSGGRKTKMVIRQEDYLTAWHRGLELDLTALRTTTTYTLRLL